MKGLKLTILLLFAFGLTIKSQVDENQVSEGFELGNADLIATQMAEVIELNIPEAEGTFSRDVSHKKLISFFNNHAVFSFEIVHRGETDASSIYHIGNLETNHGNYRVYLLYTNQGEQKLSEIRIETDE